MHDVRRVALFGGGFVDVPAAGTEWMHDGDVVLSVVPAGTADDAESPAVYLCGTVLLEGALVSCGGMLATTDAGGASTGEYVRLCARQHSLPAPRELQLQGRRRAATST